MVNLSNVFQFLKGVADVRCSLLMARRQLKGRGFSAAAWISFLSLVNLLKPSGYVMHQQFNINNSPFCPHCIYVFCIYLRTNSDLCHLQHVLIGFYNRDEKCLPRGTNWVFKYSSLLYLSENKQRLVPLIP